MNIYLKWTDADSAYNSNISLFDLEIFQSENNFAKARFVIEASVSLPQAGTEGIIVQENGHILFKGLLIGTFIKIEGSFGEIELLARPTDFMEKMIALQRTSRVAPYWDGLWVRSDKHQNFEEIQDVRTASLYCDSRTGDLSYSDWFEGTKTIHIGEHFFQQSLQIKLTKPPLKACTINVHAHWIQSDRGIANLSPQIRRAFPLGKISTYTQKSLLKKWPEPQRRLGRSGLWILKSKLKPMIPCVPLYPLYSPPLSLGTEGQKRLFRIKRYWFKPILWVRWQIRQKRRETLSVTLSHDVQPIFPGGGEHKTIDFTLHNINPDPNVYMWQPNHFYEQGTKTAHEGIIYKCKVNHISRTHFEGSQWAFKKPFHTPLGNPARASFFLTDRGYQAAEHAMERAKVILAHSARCLEVSFEGTWDVLKEVTTDHSLTLSDPRLPGGSVTGKVVKHTLIAVGETGERMACVTLLCSAGTRKVRTVESSPESTYGLENYGEMGYQVHQNQICSTPSGLSYFRYDEQQPPTYVERSPVLKNVQLTHGPTDQEAKMLENTYSSPESLQKTLTQNSTRLQLFFRDMRTRERLDHLIRVRMASGWSAPFQYPVFSRQ